MAKGTVVQKGPFGVKSAGGAPAKKKKPAVGGKAGMRKTKQPAVRAKRPAPKTPNGNAGRTSYSYQ